MIKVGIIGLGNIARTMARTINGMESAELVAVATRNNLEKAKAFAEEFGVARYYGSYDELFEDDQVELVYVATLMSQHKKDMLDALKHNKPVLCEKSFTINSREAEEVLSYSKEKNIYVGEAIWTRYMPSRFFIDSYVKSGQLGRITSISANLSYPILQKERIARPELGGGSMLDLSVYPINFALMFLPGEKLENIGGSAVVRDGVDIRESLSFSSEKGSLASLYTDTETMGNRLGVIYFDRGRIEVENINNPEIVRVYRLEGRELELIEERRFTHRQNGFEYEVEAAERAIRAGRIEPEEMPHSEILRVMRLMDEYRKLFGVRLADE